jgi:predicted nuclease of predicted toxin-antitoxin system
VRFLLDTNVPKALTKWLIDRGHNAEHVLDLGIGQAADTALWQRASETRAIIISKDEDFADLVRQSPTGPSLLWLRTGNGTARQLLGIIGPLWPTIEERLSTNERLVEVR